MSVITITKDNFEKEVLQTKDISQAVITRLPRYFRYLGELKDAGVARISSQELSRIMHVTASQIRQDLNHFGGFGQQGYGYNVESLYVEIGNISDETMLVTNLTENCIPQSIFDMTVEDYDNFLIERRKLMAKLIERYYKNL